jgi:ABC-type dipeptide/oligopeptide/nickel transport system permease component
MLPFPKLEGSRMLEVLFRQGVLSLVKLLVFATIIFALTQFLVPGDWIEQSSALTSAAQRHAARDSLGLDLSLGQRYWQWINDLFRLDLGRSFTGRPVADLLAGAVAPTLLVFGAGTALALSIGLWLGVRTGWAGAGWPSQLATLAGLGLFTAFPPWLAWLVAYAFARGRGFALVGEAGGLRGVSYQGLRPELWAAAGMDPSTVLVRMLLTALAAAVCFLLANGLLQRWAGRRLPGPILLLLTGGGAVGLWYLLGMEALAFDLVRMSWLAILTCTLLSFGEAMVLMQASVRHGLQAEYVTTAQAKGLSPAAIRQRHVAHNALLPVLRRLAISLPYLITAVLFVEGVLGWPGLGTTLWNALYWQDMPVVMATVLVVGVLSLAARLVLDIIVAYVDPRIPYDGQEPLLVSDLRS